MQGSHRICAALIHLGELPAESRFSVWLGPRKNSHIDRRIRYGFEGCRFDVTMNLCFMDVVRHTGKKTLERIDVLE